MSQRSLSLLIATLLGITLHAQQPLMRNLFAAMPDSVLPLLTLNNRLDCIDFIENGMEARVHDRMDNNVYLEALTPTYLRLRTSDATLFEAKLLPVADSLSVIAIVSTALIGTEGTPTRLTDSQLILADTLWHSLPTQPFAAGSPLPPSAFVAATAPLTAEASAAVAALSDIVAVAIDLSPDTDDITLTLQTSFLDIAQRKAIASLLQPITLHWDGQTFVP